MTKAELDLNYVKIHKQKIIYVKFQVNISKGNKIEIAAKGNTSYKNRPNTTEVKLDLHYVRINSYAKFQVDVT